MNPNNSAIKIKITLTNNRKYMFEQMRIILKLDDFQSVVVIAFMRFLSSNDLTFSDEVITVFTSHTQVPEENTNRIILFKKPNVLSVLLPLPEEENWLQRLENKTGQRGASSLIALSLEELYLKNIS